MKIKESGVGGWGGGGQRGVKNFDSITDWEQSLEIGMDIYSVYDNENKGVRCEGWGQGDCFGKPIG